MAETNVYQRLQKARVEFHAKDIKKTGVNKYSEYTYFTLENIVTPAQEVCTKNGLLVLFDVVEDLARVRVVNTDNPDDQIVFTIPFIVPESPVNKSGSRTNNTTQQLGGAITYERRYAWMIVMDVIENDEFDSTSGKPEDVPSSNRPATPEVREEAKKQVMAVNDQAPKPMLTILKNNAKAFSEADKSEEAKEYIKKLSAKTKKFTSVSKADAEKLIVELRDKIKNTEVA